MSSLPVWFDIDNDDLSLEKKLRHIIHEESFSELRPSEEENDTQLSVDSPHREDIENDDPDDRDDIDVSLF